MPDHTNVIGRRVVAYLIDLVLLAMPLFLVISAEFEYTTRATYEAEGSNVPFGDACDTYTDQTNGICVQLDDRIYFTDSFSAAPTVVGLGLSFLYFAVLQGLSGWTIGKLLAGIRTVRDDGRVPGIGRAALRWVLLLVDAFPYFAPLVGFITALTTQGHRRVGDMAAKTFVVRKAAAGQPVVVPGLTPAGYGQQWGPPPAQPGAWGATATPPPPGQPPETSEPAPSSTAPDDPAATGWAAPSGAEVPAAAQPEAAPAGQETAPTPSPAAPSAEGPQWDEARGTYIQWDPSQSKWLQWDESARSWQVIPGQ